MNIRSKINFSNLIERSPDYLFLRFWSKAVNLLQIISWIQQNQNQHKKYSASNEKKTKILLFKDLLVWVVGYHNYKK